MYKMKPEISFTIKSKRLNRQLARTIGVTEGYISQIVNCRRLSISKTTAYAVAKAISSDYEIADVFQII